MRNAVDDRDRYANERSAGARLVEREAFGHDLGLNGYTTRRQAEVLRNYLHVDRDQSVLEVGAGRGWPGWYVIEPIGCRLVSTDIPREPLLEAKMRGAATEHQVVAADARALPFCNEAFQGIIHADAFC